MSETRASRVAADGRRLGFGAERTIAGGDTSALLGRNLVARAYPQRVAADVRRLGGTWASRPWILSRQEAAQKLAR